MGPVLSCGEGTKGCLSWLVGARCEFEVALILLSR